jgi:hypothetical protein
VKLPQVFKRKFIAVLAIIIAVGWLVPRDEGWNLSSTEIICFLFWLAGAIFLLRRQLWAVVLLTLMAIYQLLFDVIREIPYLRNHVEEMSKETGVAEPIVQVSLSIVIAIEAAIMVCVIYYAITIIFGNKDVE